VTIGEKIQSLRAQRGLTQDQLAASMNRSTMTIADWESGAVAPDVASIVALSGVLNVSTDYLLKEPEPAKSNVQQHKSGPFDIRVGHWGDVDDYEDDDGIFELDRDLGIRGGFHLELSNAIYPVAVLVYLFLGFVHGLWHPGWVVFIGAWVLEEIAGFVKNGKLRISVYGVAGGVFVILGLFFIPWSYALLVFVVAWIIDEVVVRDKPGKKRRKKRREDYWQQ